MAKLITALAALALLLGAAAAGWAQEPAPGPGDEATLFIGQPPLTEAEIKTYLVTMDAMLKGWNDPVKMMAALEDHGWDKLRFSYVNTRVNSALEVIKGGEAAGSALRAGLRPTEEELALVKPWSSQLDALNEQALEIIKQQRQLQAGRPQGAPGEGSPAASSPESNN